MKASVILNERGAQLRLDAENDFEQSLIEYLDFDYSASVIIEREDSFRQWHEKTKAKAAVFSLLRNVVTTDSKA